VVGNLAQTGRCRDSWLVPAATTLDEELPVVVRAPFRFGLDLSDPKFRCPGRRQGVVRRSELLARLQRDHERRLILITAPAGYGKTTLLGQWVQEDPRPCAWVTLDHADGVILEDSIATALTEAGAGVELGSDIILVLDDGHVLPPQRLRDAVLDVLDWLPEGSQLAVASRDTPRLPLSRMRAERVLLEIDSHDLSMSSVEAAPILRSGGLDPRSASAQSLALRTEGWPAALELATMSWARRPEPTQTAALVMGDDHVISEYFRTELLDSLSPAAARFLIRTSVLDRLSGPLCDEVLGRGQSATLLGELERANIPLVPDDASHEWYRLHGLFREMLQTQLRRSEPEMVPVLHQRANGWYRRAGDVDRALDHAILSDDLDGAGELLWANLHRYLGAGRNDMVQRWLSGLSAERVSGCALLALAAAHSDLASGSVAAAERWARSAAASLFETNGLQQSAGAGVLIIQAWAARSGAREMGAVATTAYELLRDDSPWRASCCFLRGSAALLTGEEAEAERRFEEGAARGAVLAPDVASLSLAQLAVIAAERDEAVIASDFACRAALMVHEHGLTTAPTSALVFAVAAAAAMREGRVDQAKTAANQCVSLLGLLDDSLAWLGAETRIVLARVSLALGDVAGARELLADASRLARRTADVIVFQRWFDDVWNRFDERAETALAGMATLTTAELRVLRFLPTHYSFHEIAQRLHVSSNTVKTHVHAVYRKLDASSRSEAVAHATHAGLIGV
jgi:LuxR family transcriptional regulator, maltose regulon positive regulatory protein